jgi:ribonuclease HI
MEETVEFENIMVAYVDGASNSHIKRSGVGIAWFYQKQLINTHRGETLKKNEKPCACYGEEIFSNRKNIKCPTNNDAEYMSLIRAMEEAILYNVKGIIVFMDSKLVVNQVNNKWKINYDHLQNYKLKVDSLRKKVRINVYHIRREYNQWADYFSKYIIDKTKSYQDKQFHF